MHWFLTNRTIHLWISLVRTYLPRKGLHTHPYSQSILISLVFGVWLSEFIHNTPYHDLLPPNSMFLSHPFSFIGRWAEVYNMHVAYVSAQTAERRKQKVDDVKKRSDYRKAHGLDQEEGIFGGWTAKTEEETRGPALKDESMTLAQAGPEPVMDLAQKPAEDAVCQAGEAEETYVDFEGKTQPLQKKWFGIW